MLSANELLEQAKRVSGLDDYGNMAFAEGLHVLVKSINEESALTPSNEAGARGELLRVLINRLRMQKDLVRHPEILDEELLPPVFITSMPRTGSTKLHRLLAASGSFNALTYWQAYNFAPFPGHESNAESGKPDLRIAAAEAHLQHLYKKAPGYQAFHPMYTEEAEEELALLDACFSSMFQYAAILEVPSYVQWVLGRDGLQMFRDLRAILQYIQWQHYRAERGNTRRRWVLKTPALFGLEGAFAQVNSGADFIVTHRHPDQTAASMCALFCGAHELFSEHDYTQVAGPAMLYGFGEMMKMHLQWRDTFPTSKVIDIRFDEVMGNEVAVVSKIHDFLGMPFSEKNANNVAAWVAMDAKRGHQRSSKTLSDYGLTLDTVHQTYGPLIKRYAEFLVTKAK
jgi:Sulfotransferase family